MDRDRNTPNQAADKDQAEGERWGSESDTVEQRDRDRLPTADDRTMGQEVEGSGITNRPLDEEMNNQQRVPERGESREGAHAGHGNRDRTSIEEE